MDKAWLRCRMPLTDVDGQECWLTPWLFSVPVIEGGEYEVETMDTVVFERLARQGLGMGLLRRFAGETDVVPGVMLPTDLPEHDLLNATVAAYEAGRLVVLRKAGKGPTRPAARSRGEAQRLSREISHLSHGKLICDGRTYTLTAEGHIDRSALGLTHQIVPLGEALDLLAKMVRLHSAHPELANLIGDAVRLLSTAERGPGQEPELVLLRHLARPKPQGANSEPAMTPSQLARDLQGTWYELYVVDEIGQPISGIQVRIDIDGETHRGNTDAAGLFRVSAVPKGNATARFADPAGLLDLLDRRWSEDRSDDWIVAPKDAVVLEVCRAASAWRESVSLHAAKTTLLVIEPPYWVHLFDEDGKQLAGIDFKVRVGDSRFDVTSDSQGWIEFPVGEQCPECATVEWNQGDVRRSMEFVLDCHQGTPQDVAHSRLWNMGFHSDDFEDAVRSFRSEFGFHDRAGDIGDDERQELDRRWLERIA